MTIQHIRFQHRALQRYRRRIERIELSPKDAVDAAETVARLEWQIAVRWSVLFSAFLQRVNGY